MKKKFSRRDFLKTSSFVLTASFLAACERLIPPINTPTAAVPPAKENARSVLNPSPNQPSPTQPSTATVISTNSSPPPVLNSPLDDTPDVFMNTYSGAVGASPPSPQNPKGIHQGMDFVAPTGTPVKAVAPGTISRIMPETKTEYDGTVNTYANVILDIGGRNSIIYIFEPLQNLLVSEGQKVKTGDILGTLADNRGQNMRHTMGTGTLDFGLMSLVGGSFLRVCFVPYASPTFKKLMETWFSRAYTATAEHPGPCVCHYHYP
jgi:murein DD-endopeptidase MepM/ murein hydrolase activator NlpD